MLTEKNLLLCGKYELDCKIFAKLADNLKAAYEVYYNARGLFAQKKITRAELEQAEKGYYKCFNAVSHYTA